MLRTSLTQLNTRSLRLWLLLFFIALALPTAFLVRQAYSELRWEALHQYRLLAEELSVRIDRRFIRLIEVEEAHAFADFSFLNIAGDPASHFLQRSPLSAYPVASSVPGLIGYFQVDAQGGFSTPLLPKTGTGAVYGVSAEEGAQRLALQNRILKILADNRLVQDKKADRALTAAAPEVDTALNEQAATAAQSLSRDEREDVAEPQPAAQAAFDRLNSARLEKEKKRAAKAVGKLGRVEDLKLDDRYQVEADAAPPPAEKQARRERGSLPETASVALPGKEEALQQSLPAARVRTFESEIDPFEFSLLDSGHFVLYRKVWRDGQRYIQGALIERQAFLREMIRSMFLDTALSQMSDLIVAYHGEVFSAFSVQTPQDYLSHPGQLEGALLLQAPLSAPLSELELVFSIRQLPAGPGSAVINWLAGIIAVVLCGGFFLMYRLGAGQIALARQQQDFVSAVSHELKTPLTSIRMYGEMLREGWASEDKKKTYYEFIYDESERLSRLINNVLQLARLSRNHVQADLASAKAAELMDIIRSRVGSQCERAGFELGLDLNPDSGEVVVVVDIDFFSQIMINLVDNAIKFSAGAEQKRIDIACRQLDGGSLQLSVRDYGPGIAADQMKKIFQLFYRSENELTRETVGTGIGLALVHQLVVSMNGSVDVVNRSPGAEFNIIFPVNGNGVRQ